MNALKLRQLPLVKDLSGGVRNYISQKASIEHRIQIRLIDDSIS
jgi:hypothetical protein